MKLTRLITLFVLVLLIGCAGSSTTRARGSSNGASAAPGECEIVGSWAGPVPAGMLAGNTLTMVFSEEGTAQGTCGRITLNSTWQRRGDLVQVVDVSAQPSFARCDPNLIGRYTLEFAANCQSVRAISGEDPCEHRRQALLGFRATRR